MKFYKKCLKEQQSKEQLVIEKIKPTLNLDSHRNKKKKKQKKKKETKFGFYKKNSLIKNNSNYSNKGHKNINIKFNIVNLYNISTENNKNKSTNKEDIFLKTKDIMKYTELELNELNYKSALKYDQRSYCEYYFSLLKTKHDLIFTFCYNDDYNSKIIKIDLFFINFVMNYTINALFFNDDTMHKIYEEKGKFQFLYQLPQIIYSSIISQILNWLLQLLALSEDLILEFKNNNNNEYNVDERKIKLIKILLIKFILYFIISSIFLFIFWFYISLFCYIYENTQMHLLNDTLISFGLSLLYPFGIYLLPGIFRIPSLSNRMKNNEKNGKGKYLYNFSKFLQIL